MNGALLLVFLPCGAAQISTYNSFDWEHLELANNLGATFELVLVGRERWWDGCADEMVGTDVGEDLAEPELGDGGEEFAFGRNTL